MKKLIYSMRKYIVLLDEKNYGGGEPRKSIRHSKGWPEVRDPAAERQAVSPLDGIGEGATRKLAQRTSPAPRTP